MFWALAFLYLEERAFSDIFDMYFLKSLVVGYCVVSAPRPQRKVTCTDLLERQYPARPKSGLELVFLDSASPRSGLESCFLKFLDLKVASGPVLSSILDIEATSSRVSLVL